MSHPPVAARRAAENAKGTRGFVTCRGRDSRCWRSDGASPMATARLQQETGLRRTQRFPGRPFGAFRAVMGCPSQLAGSRGRHSTVGRPATIDPRSLFRLSHSGCTGQSRWQLARRSRVACRPALATLQRRARSRESSIPPSHPLGCHIRREQRHRAPPQGRFAYQFNDIQRQLVPNSARRAQTADHHGHRSSASTTSGRGHGPQ